MSRLIIVLFLSTTALVGIGASEAKAQTYVDDVELYAGDAVQVYVGGAWYAATVLDAGGSSVLVRYTNGGQEWVDYGRVSVVGVTSGVVYQPTVQVYWGNGWYDGRILAVRGDRYQVYYHGRTEWIGRDRWHHHRHGFQRGHRTHYDNHGYRDGGRRGGRHEYRNNDNRGGRDRGNRGGRDRGNRGGGRGHRR